MEEKKEEVNLEQIKADLCEYFGKAFLQDLILLNILETEFICYDFIS